MGSATSLVCPRVLATAGADALPSAPATPFPPDAPWRADAPWAPEAPWTAEPPAAAAPDLEALSDTVPWPPSELEPQPASGTAAAAQHTAAIEKRSIFIVLQG